MAKAIYRRVYLGLWFQTAETVGLKAWRLELQPGAHILNQEAESSHWEWHEILKLKAGP